MLLLHIDASPRDASDRRGLADLVIREGKRKKRLGIMGHRPAGRDPPPHVTQDVITGIHTPPDKRTPAQQQAVALPDKLADEFLSADVILLSTPMDNQTVPSALKAYIDQRVRSARPSGSRTAHSKDRPPGSPCTSSPRTAATPRAPPWPPSTTSQPHLRTVFGFVGITDIQFLPAEFLDARRTRATSRSRGRTRRSCG